MPRRKQKRYEITSMDTGKTFVWTETKCRRYFGQYEWQEIKQGYAPHLVVVEVGENYELTT
jgi:hypothetical protein